MATPAQNEPALPTTSVALSLPSFPPASLHSCVVTGVGAAGTPLHQQRFLARQAAKNIVRLGRIGVYASRSRPDMLGPSLGVFDALPDLAPGELDTTVPIGVCLARKAREARQRSAAAKAAEQAAQAALEAALHVKADGGGVGVATGMEGVQTQEGAKVPRIRHDSADGIVHASNDPWRTLDRMALRCTQTVPTEGGELVRLKWAQDFLREDASVGMSAWLEAGAMPDDAPVSVRDKAQFYLGTVHQEQGRLRAVMGRGWYKFLPGPGDLTLDGVDISGEICLDDDPTRLTFKAIQEGSDTTVDDIIIQEFERMLTEEPGCVLVQHGPILYTLVPVESTANVANVRVADTEETAARKATEPAYIVPVKLGTMVDALCWVMRKPEWRQRQYADEVLAAGAHALQQIAGKVAQCRHVRKWRVNPTWVVTGGVVVAAGCHLPELEHVPGRTDMKGYLCEQRDGSAGSADASLGDGHVAFVLVRVQPSMLAAMFGCGDNCGSGGSAWSSGAEVTPRMGGSGVDDDGAEAAIVATAPASFVRLRGRATPALTPCISEVATATAKAIATVPRAVACVVDAGDAAAIRAITPEAAIARANAWLLTAGYGADGAAVVLRVMGAALLPRHVRGCNWPCLIVACDRKFVASDYAGSAGSGRQFWPGKTWPLDATVDPHPVTALCAAFGGWSVVQRVPPRADRDTFQSAFILWVTVDPDTGRLSTAAASILVAMQEGYTVVVRCQHRDVPDLVNTALALKAVVISGWPHTLSLARETGAAVAVPVSGNAAHVLAPVPACVFRACVATYATTPPALRREPFLGPLHGLNARMFRLPPVLDAHSCKVLLVAEMMQTRTLLALAPGTDVPATLEDVQRAIVTYQGGHPRMAFNAKFDVNTGTGLLANTMEVPGIVEEAAVVVRTGYLGGSGQRCTARFMTSATDDSAAISVKFNAETFSNLALCGTLLP